MVDALVIVGMMSTLPCSQDKSERSGFKVFGTVSFPTTAPVSGLKSISTSIQTSLPKLCRMQHLCTAWEVGSFLFVTTGNVQKSLA